MDMTFSNESTFTTSVAVESPTTQSKFLSGDNAEHYPKRNGKSGVVRDRLLKGNIH